MTPMDYVKRHTQLAYDAKAREDDGLAAKHFAAANAHRSSHLSPLHLRAAAQASQLAFDAETKHDPSNGQFTAGGGSGGGEKKKGRLPEGHLFSKKTVVRAKVGESRIPDGKGGFVPGANGNYGGPSSKPDHHIIHHGGGRTSEVHKDNLEEDPNWTKEAVAARKTK